jgi:hypothetical protein
VKDSLLEYKKVDDILIPMLIMGKNPDNKKKLFIYFYFSTHGAMYDGSPMA